MDRKVRVLVFPCGKENGLEVYSALRYAFNLEVFGGSSVRDHGEFVYENYVGNIPFIGDPTFIESFSKIIEQHRIDVVIPTHDMVSLYFANNAKEFNTKIIVPDAYTARVCRDKGETYELFSGDGILPKRFYTITDIKETDLPVFIKPKSGQGGKDSAKCNTIKEAEFFLSNPKDNLITEFLPGEELTVDCFTNKDNKLLFIGPRLRNRVNMGISFNSTRYNVTEEINSIANVISSKLHFRGLWYFQLKKNKEGKFKLLEISCRTSGTMIFYRMLGVNFPLLSVYDALGYEVNILFNDLNIELDRCIKNRFKIDYYFDTIYIDFDETIILNGKVNDIALQFLYQMFNKGKKIILITHHEKILDESLNQYRISKKLFDEIIHLPNTENKFSFMKKEKSIFIDNKFSEREKVFSTCRIPVFDVDAIEAFII